MNKPTPSSPAPPYLPLPRPSGIAALLIASLSFLAGTIRGEIILFLVAFMLAVCLAYSFFAVLALSCAHARRARRLSARLSPDKIAAGGEVTLALSEENGGPASKPLFGQLPAVLVRYQLSLATKDGKRLERQFARDFFSARQCSFAAPPRGLYSGEQDRLLIFDVFGFFRAAHAINCGARERLRVSPALPPRVPFLPRFSGGGEHRGEHDIIRTDDLIEQRPYMPGDDPRRINWKLYGHLGSLFVREEDREPPPHTRLALLICPEVDESLPFARPTGAGWERARRGAAEVDLLCETALAIITECAESGVEVFVGSCGAGLAGGENGAAGDALATPYAARLAELPPLPAVDDEKELLILALPRGYHHQKNALDAFLGAKNTARKITILFVYHDERLAGPAMASALAYGNGGYRGVYAKALER